MHLADEWLTFLAKRPPQVSYNYKIGCLDRIAQKEAPRAEVSEWPATATATAVATETATAGTHASGRGTAWITRHPQRRDHSSDLLSIAIDI